MDDKQEHWDNMYTMSLEKIPWEIEMPPSELVDFLNAESIEKGSVLDVGCGTGNYSFYLAEQGFREVVGVDFSQNALVIALEKNKKLGLPIVFIHTDATKLIENLPDFSFDFIFDYSLLHHISPAEVEGYAKQFCELLKDGGKLLMVCYSDKDIEGQTIVGKYGNDMFYRTREEIEKLYSDLKVIDYKEVRLGKRLQHIAHQFVFTK